MNNEHPLADLIPKDDIAVLDAWLEETKDCPECHGAGMKRYPYPSRLDPEAEAEWDTCHTCDGKKTK